MEQDTAVSTAVTAAAAAEETTAPAREGLPVPDGGDTLDIPSRTAMHEAISGILSG